MENRAKTKNSIGLSLPVYAALLAAFMFSFCLSVCAGSVRIPFSVTLSAIGSMLSGNAAQTSGGAIVTSVRLPRVLCAALSGAALSLSGAAMQGLLKNPLADGSTLGVSSGASLGAALFLAFGTKLPLLPETGAVGMAMAFALLSLLLILFLAYRLDCTLSTNTIILIGVIFSMFASALISLVVTFAGSHAKSILFWTMGSLSGTGYSEALTLLVALITCGSVLLLTAGELNAFAVGEDNARHVGVDVKRVKRRVLIAVSVLIGVSVSVGGTIGFVGLVVPHMTRMLTGPNHKKLLPAALLSGATFLMLADLLARTVLSPLELPIGVVTSLIGSVAFVLIFARTRGGK